METLCKLKELGRERFTSAVAKASRKGLPFLMLVVKIELWPGGDENRAKEIGRAHIWNDGSGTETRGNYKGKIFRRGSRKVVWREGQVFNFPRKALKAWDLLQEFLNEVL